MTKKQAYRKAAISLYELIDYAYWFVPDYICIALYRLDVDLGDFEYWFESEHFPGRSADFGNDTPENRLARSLALLLMAEII